MQIHHTIAAARAALAPLRQSGRIVFVPTMGNLHEGHITLMRQARNHGDTVVSSIFVNRLQFRPGEDFEKYPRTFAADCEKLVAAGVDLLFAPSEEELYPEPQSYAVEPPTEHANILEGEFRPGHFGGVATVVMKLFAIVQPQAALFGKKDYQQFLVIKQMVKDLNFNVRIKICPIVREKNGLAMSSRNSYLSQKQRDEAPILYKSLVGAKNKILSGKTSSKSIINWIDSNIKDNSSGIVDYIECVNADTLDPITKIKGRIMIAIAVKFGKTRLIDNIVFHSR